MSGTDQDRSYPIYWFEEISSTMDKARDLGAQKGDIFFAVGAESQTKGRGSRGRVWLAPKGNLFLTVCMQRTAVPVPITLLPLRVGLIIASCMNKRITTGTQVKLKWPNDILIDSKKACGVLIETEGDMLVIGIGCNVLVAPAVNAATNNANAAPLIRPSTCLAEYNPAYAEVAAQRRKQQEQELGAATAEGAPVDEASPISTTAAALNSPVAVDEPQPFAIGAGDFHKELAADICDALFDWTQARTDTADLVLQDFTANMDFSPQRLRDEPNEAVGIVVPTAINQDGTLQVKYAHNGEPGMLVAEYLW